MDTSPVCTLAGASLEVDAKECALTLVFEKAGCAVQSRDVNC